ncbi:MULTISPECIES: MFS transporter [unclassified Streptomyces]|uniref:MFS transporter n=1 Tax=unclassified Streptomyces TaxID=2593676 RepID=UPI002E2CF370|nr:MULTISPECIES: MFS transporter [unclassified Streptomyces]WUB90229.1 MFS transporter [Streptomyces sp. NBC_00566]
MRVSRIVPPPGPPRTLALAQLTNSVGDGAYYVCSVLYFSRIIGLSPTQIGAALTVGWALGAVVGVPLGHLADRRGPRGIAILMSLATGTAIASLLLVRTYPAFLAAVCLYTCCQCGLAAARQALLAGLVEPARRTETRAYLQSTVNAGLALGAALGGIALQLDNEASYLTALAMDAVTFVLAAWVLGRLPAPARQLPSAGRPAERSLTVLRDRPYAVVSLLNMVMLLYMPLLSVVLPLWIVQRTEAPGWTVSALLVLNTLSVVLFQVRMAARVTGPRSAARAVRQAGIVLLLACVCFAVSAAGTSVWLPVLVLLLAACVQVFGEMLLGSGSWEIGFALAPADKQGQYQGFYGAGTAVARLIGPLLLTTLILSWGTGGWLVVGALFLGAGIAMEPAVRWAQARRPAEMRESAPVRD